MRQPLWTTLILALTAAGPAGAQAVAPAPPAPVACAGRADALGTSRTLVVGTGGGLAVGWKTYPKTLVLADHEVVLTFDDGPLPATTAKVLDALAAECVHATFFLIGRNAHAAPALVKREVADGHTVGHHSWSHPEITLRGLPDDKARADIDHGFAADDIAAYGVAGAVPRVPFFRFPGFADTGPLLTWLAGRDIAVFGADLWASDWVPMTPDGERELLLKRLDAAGRGIVLLHDVKAQTAAMLPAFLRDLKARGYHVVHIVPGPAGTTTPTTPAPVGWTSETEATVERTVPQRIKAAATARRRATRTPPLSSGVDAPPAPL